MLHAIGRRSSSGKLIDLFLECHQRIRTFARIAEEVGRRRDLTTAEVIDSCQRCERYFTEALPLHVEDEEKSLSPRLRGAGREVEEALVTMHAQHLEHEPLLQVLLASLRDVQGDPSLGQHRQRLMSAAAHLVGEFEKHLALEERIIFPAVLSHVPGDVQQRILEELRARRRSPASG